MAANERGLGMVSDDDKNKSDIVIAERFELETKENYLALITLNRPKDLNPIDWETIQRVHTVFKELMSDQSNRVIVFIGAGRAFSAGGDLKAYLTLMSDEEGFRSFLEDFAALQSSMRNAPQPVIALINGICVAGGLELLLACDFAYAAESAKIGDGHVNFGQIGGAGSQVLLPRTILPSRAREIIFTGKLFSAAEALEWGLVNRVVPDGELMEAGLAFANSVATKSPLGIRIIRQLMARSLDLSEEEAAYLERQMVHHYCLTSHDCREGLLAFSETRPPKFKGR